MVCTLPNGGLKNFACRAPSDPEQILTLSEQFQQERLREIEALLLAGRTADVLFEGEIEAIGPAEWSLPACLLQIDSETVIEGTPQVGELARVDGRTEMAGCCAPNHPPYLLRRIPIEPPLPAVRPTIEASRNSRAQRDTRFTTPANPRRPKSVPAPTPSPGDCARRSAPGHKHGGR